MKAAITYHKGRAGIKQDTILMVVTLALLALWIPVVAYKGFFFEAFRNGMLQHSFPDWIGHILAWSLPALELAAIILLVVPKTHRFGLWLSAMLLLGYTVYVALGVMTDLVTFNCYCSKLITAMSWWGHFWFNLTLLTISIVGIILIEKEKNRGGKTKGHAIKGGSAK
ncbi:MauE/DoxX family redox-associated membrane protein [Parapedobacter koreensis]|uniref:Methylamine utilisation protein MauE n=1 Tax=Parapedobacter koreensis TaxID=332977 RepID=A0A1H7P5V2_9SPHI|nr:MauE/DoxX family redox-associated membrane protein [Parapedobacter koreensis]SEL31181.1 Methylamine utilisation protein MauE [Parapedobacter koreensis]